MKKCGETRLATDDSIILCMCFACWITKAMHAWRQGGRERQACSQEVTAMQSGMQSGQCREAGWQGKAAEQNRQYKLGRAW